MKRVSGWARKIRLAWLLAGLGMAFSGSAAVLGDEGMWLFNSPPMKTLKEKYNFEPDRAWFEHLQRASVRFNSGGSGSFVSSNGLVLTNHHVGADDLQKLSTKDKNYLADGFYAKTQAEELKCVDLELNVLMSIEDVTDRVNAAVPKNGTLADSEKARRAIMNTIEQESTEKTGLRSDVITLYNGGQYQLYRYKKYTDVRLVFAPEEDAAFFGGDPDNFEYPRYDLDICFFRVYENGKPAKIEHYLQWAPAGAADDELIFVSGHPGKSDRLNTVAHLDYLRDLSLPAMLNWLMRNEVLLVGYSERSYENARRAREELFNIQNSRKAQIGRLAGLQDPAVMEAKQAAEKVLRDAVQNDAALRDSAGSAWGDVAAALKTLRTIRKDVLLLEEGRAFRCRQFLIARTLLRMAEEDGKPNADRLREYRQSNRESLEQMLFSKAPIYDDLETLKLADGLSMFVTEAGADNDLVVKVLNGKSPRDRAAELIRGSGLKDVAVRRELAKGGKAAIEASDDPMIQLALLVDGPARKVRRTLEQQVDEPLRQAYAKIAKARFAVLGSEAYPDATFTLRLAFGVVKGYDELGQPQPPWTTLGGAYQHSAEHQNRAPFNLPKRWFQHKGELNLDAPLNFVCTADIIGGNSGSPVVNRQGQFVGIIFDGNLDSLVWDFIYTDKVGRAIAVHSAAIEETLRKLYGAGALADELGK
ncbi:MAG: S46 family peptidase [Thermoguttaceae bacterium]